MHRRGFTLVEMVTAVAVVGIGIGIFYTVFLQNWWAFDDQFSRINLWQDANEIARLITDDVRASSRLAVTTNEDVKTATLILPDGSSIVYSMNREEVLQRTKGGTTSILSQNVDFQESSFIAAQNSLKLTLTLWDTVFGRRVEVSTSTQVFPRCTSC